MTITQSDIEAILESNPALGEALLRKLQEKKDEDSTPPYIEALFGPQRRFFLDPAKKKAAVCSRRAGKTEGVAAWLLDGARDCPGGLSVYIALSRNNCRLILWATLQAIEARHKIGLRFVEQDNQLNVITPNGHRIWLAGCKDSAEIEKFRGIKLRRAAIDEGASYGPYLRDLVFDVLEPALLDLNGELCIIGTPGAIPAGLFFEITTGAGNGPGAAAKWSTHSWTCLNNPYIQLNDVPEADRSSEVESAQSGGYINPRVDVWLENKREQNNWDESHPTYQREWLGIWLRDEGALVYPVDPAKNMYSRLPIPWDDKDWNYAIGVDVGYEDSTAFVVGAYRKGHPEVYIVHVEKRQHLIPSKVAAYLERLQKKYNAFEIIMDTGGIGKAYAEECSQRYGIYCEPAQKRNKRAYIEIIRGELMSGSIKIHRQDAGQLLEECSRLVWDEKHEAPDERFEDHAADAFLYLVRALLPWYRPEIEHKPLTREEQVNKEAADHKAKTMKAMRDRAKKRLKSGDVMRDIASGKRYM